MPETIYLLETVQLLVARLVRSRDGAIQPLLTNRTRHQQLIVSGAAEEIVQALLEPIEAAFAIASQKVMISLSRVDETIRLEAVVDDDNKLAFGCSLPGQIRNQHRPVPSGGAVECLLLCSTDQPFVTALEQLPGFHIQRQQCNLTAAPKIATQKFTAQQASSDPVLLDRRAGNFPRHLDCTPRNDGRPRIEIHPLRHLIAEEGGKAIRLGWPFFDTDIAEVLEHQDGERQLQVLLADDSNASRMATQLILEKLNCNVTNASDGESALLAANSRVYDMIFLDEKMPGLTGSEVSEHIRNSHSVNQRTSIVSITGLTDKESIDMLYQRGICTHLVKPLNKSVLNHCLDQWRQGEINY